MGRRSIWQNILSYRQHSLFAMNFLLILGIIAFITISMGMGFYLYYDELVRSAIQDSNNDALSRLQNIIDMVAVDVDRMSLRLSNDRAIVDYLKSDMPDSFSYDTIQGINKIKDILKISNFASDYIDSVELYSVKNNYVLSSIYDIGDVQQLDQISRDLLDSGTNVWTRPKTRGTGRYITNYRKVNLEGNRTIGLVMINIDLVKFRELLQESGSVGYEAIYIVDSGNNILFSTREEEIGRLFDESIALSGEASHKDAFVANTNSQYNRWRYVSVGMPEAYYKNKMEYLRQILLGSLLASIVIAVIGSLWVARKVYQPINILMDVIRNSDENSMSEKMLEKNKSNELMHIISNIIESYKRNYEMNQELLKRQVLLEKAQNIALQAQINPHFLYNTLENINWKVLALSGESNEATEMIALLSRLLRDSLETEGNIISIASEIEHAKLYIEILKKRHEDAFEVLWQVAPGIMGCKITKLTLQPIIENAIYHGVMNSEEPGKVMINGYSSGGNVVLEVINEGTPMDDAAVKALNEDMQSGAIKENSQIGIRNVNQRIKLNFGSSYGLNISKDRSGNTLVKIFIPRV